MKYFKFIEDDKNRNKLWLVIDRGNAPREEVIDFLHLKEERGNPKGDWYAEWTVLSRCGARLISLSPYEAINNGEVINIKNQYVFEVDIEDILEPDQH